MLLGAIGCSGEPDEAPDTTGRGEAAGVPLDLRCEALGYPCSWSRAGEEAFHRSVELLDRAAEGLRGGGDPGRVAAELADEDDVVAVNHDATGVIFRVDGAPPVVAHAPAASPMFNGLVELARRGELPTLSAEAASPTAGAERRGVAARDVPVRRAGIGPPPGLWAGLAAGVGLAAPAPSERFPGRDRTPQEHPVDFEPLQPAGVRPRSALLVRPFEAKDARDLMGALRERGDLEWEGGIDWDAYASRLTRTEAVIRGNAEHYTLHRDHSVAAFQSFAAHDLVLLETHSSDFDCEEGREICGEVIGGPKIEATHVETRELAYRDVAELPDGATIGQIFDQWRVAFTADFFASAYGRSGAEPEGTILIVNACKTGPDEVAGPTSALIAAFGGTGAVFAWNETINGVDADELTARLVRNLVDWGIRTGDAYDELGSEDITHEAGGKQATFVWSGREIRARDVITVVVDGRPLESGDHIPVRGEPEDGKDDVIPEIAFRVDGVTEKERDAAILTWQLPRHHDEPIELEKSLSDARDVTRDREDVRWRDWLLEIEDLDLGFDLERADLVCCREHRLIAELKTGRTRPARHDVEPVFLRQETVEVLHPELGRPLASGETVEVDGEAKDGTPEAYPLVARVDHLDSDRLDEYRLAVRVHDTELERGIDELTRTGEGTYELNEPVELYDFPDREEQIVIQAELTRQGEAVGDVAIDSLGLVLDLSCDWHLRIEGAGTWAGDLSEYAWIPSVQTFEIGFGQHGVDVSSQDGGRLVGNVRPQPGRPGAVPVLYMTFVEGSVGGWVADGREVTLTITRNTGERMEGQATGVIASPREGNVKRPFTLTFEAGDMYRARPCGEDPDDR